MAEKVILKTMKCPTCGASLNAKNNTDTITCVYCNNSVVPVAEATPVVHKETVSGGIGGVLKVEGIKTSSSALAYIEQFFEEYDWEAFAYAQTLSVAEIDKLANSLKVSSADDKNTWFVCFKAISVPFVQKIAGCKKVLNVVVEEYKKDSLDAYSKFDAYKRIATMISVRKDSIIANLEKISATAAKYGASSMEVSGLKREIDNIRNLAVDVYSDIESIPEVKMFIDEKNARIAEALAAQGINAEKEYARAKMLIGEKNYVEALSVLLSLNGYSDTDALAEKIDKYYLISDILEIEGVLYYFKKDSYYSDCLCLYPTVDGKVSEKPIIEGIKQIITNYADILYYLDASNRLKKYNFATKSSEMVYNKNLDKKSIYVYGRKVFLLASKAGEYGNRSYDLVELSLATGLVRTVLENVKAIVSLTGNKMVYTISVRVNNESSSYESSNYKIFTNIINIDTLEITGLGTKKVSIEGFVDNYVVYTQVSPNEYNKNLYIKALNSAEPEKLIEKNILKFCGIIANKLFYYVGNSRNKSLINVNCDGSERREWPMYISKVLFEQGGWLYFIRQADYNSVLCKSRLDGSKFSIIAADIEEFIDIKNGYLYYINYKSALVKVRMDGSNLQELCADVETVLAVKEDKIIFVSIDDRITTGSFEQTTTKVVKSIYAVDFSGSGKIKLAYNIKNAKEYDENTVYYVAEKEIQTSNDQQDKQYDELYKLHVETNQAEKILDLEARKEEGRMSGFAIAMIVMVTAFFFAIVGFSAEAPALGVLGLVAGFVSLMIGAAVKRDKEE